MADQPQIFKYAKPDIQRGKQVVPMCRTDRLRAHVQVVKEGGENNLHAHSGNDGFWMVLGGRVRFYGEGDTSLAELGVNEGILIPHGFKYWFESVGEEPLEILHLAVSVPAVNDERVNYTPLKPWQVTVGLGGRPPAE